MVLADGWTWVLSEFETTLPFKVAAHWEEGEIWASDLILSRSIGEGGV